MFTPQNAIGPKEFITLMALLMSMVALAIDSMLPAIGLIGVGLNVSNPNDSQLIISMVFLGMAFGLMLYGPISDAFGRKRAIYLGLSIFLVGNVVSIFSQDLSQMVAGRILQGFGAAACRVVTIAMIRDRFSGPLMAKTMSLIMMIFILVPTLAPSVGQAILWFAPWQAVFVFLFLMALITMFWLAKRQPETLIPAKRIAFSYVNIKNGIIETLKNRQARTYLLSAGIMFGAFVGYLSTAQQLFQQHYGLEDEFALYFGALAFFIGIAAYTNSRLVMLFSMEKLCLIAVSIIAASSLIFYGLNFAQNTHPSLNELMVYLSISFFCSGILFGNFNTLALQPLGHIAGIANSVISTFQTFLSVIIGAVIGQLYNDSAQPMVLGFLFSSCSILVLLLYIRQGDKILKHA